MPLILRVEFSHASEKPLSAISYKNFTLMYTYALICIHCIIQWKHKRRPLLRKRLRLSQHFSLQCYYVIWLITSSNKFENEKLILWWEGWLFHSFRSTSPYLQGVHVSEYCVSVSLRSWLEYDNSSLYRGVMIFAITYIHLHFYAIKKKQTVTYTAWWETLWATWNIILEHTTQFIAINNQKLRWER